MTMPPRLNVVGALERPHHYHLPADAQCYYWGDYTPYEQTNGLKWDYSPTNRLISNFKKKMDQHGRPSWTYKQQAINQVAQSFARFWRWGELHQQYRVALIPIPPSRARTDLMYDPRMFQMLTALAHCVQLPLDIRDCLSFSGRYAASHELDNRPTPADLFGELSIHRPAEGVAPPGIIFLFDDMLTTGAHYLASVQRLAEVYPGVRVIGNFVARRCVPNPFADFEAL